MAEKSILELLDEKEKKPSILDLAKEEEPKKKVNEELLDENIQKVVKMFPRDNDWKKLVSKYKRDIENFMKGRKDLPAKVEDELLTWGFDNGEIKNEDDAERFIDDILNA